MTTNRTEGQMKNDILHFINSLRNSDEYIQHLYTMGSCYKFHILLSELFEKCTPYINYRMNHIITEYQGLFYDITGLVHDRGYRLMTDYDRLLAKSWSFSNNNMLQIGECPHCEEPLIYNHDRTK